MAVSLKRSLLIIVALFLTSFSFGQTEVVETVPLKIPCSPWNEGFCFVRNAKELKDLTSCTRFDVPKIDFENYTLIGVMHNASGCRAKDSVYVLKTGNIFTIHHNITQYGFCKPYRSFKRWFLIKNEPSIEFRTDFKLKEVLSRTDSLLLKQ